MARTEVTSKGFSRSTRGDGKKKKRSSDEEVLVRHRRRHESASPAPTVPGWLLWVAGAKGRPSTSSGRGNGSSKFSLESRSRRSTSHRRYHHSNTKKYLTSARRSLRSYSRSSSISSRRRCERPSVEGQPPAYLRRNGGAGVGLGGTIPATAPSPIPSIRGTRERPVNLHKDGEDDVSVFSVSDDEYEAEEKGRRSRSRSRSRTPRASIPGSSSRRTLPPRGRSPKRNWRPPGRV
ncbi:hypothetical protein B0H63DRAFT_524513 [Podospora didyma]|uniref:Uncharacterized protein n=1 Tax=Podospora didyma TaxID=330526 RepID=A0AAE0TW81_9PEZI|nr:hypothetical protein B0H63DRAFT_524513 [Podospora didyma]